MNRNHFLFYENAHQFVSWYTIIHRLKYHEENMHLFTLETCFVLKKHTTAFTQAAINKFALNFSQKLVNPTQIWYHLFFISMWYPTGRLILKCHNVSILLDLIPFYISLIRDSRLSTSVIKTPQMASELNRLRLADKNKRRSGHMFDAEPWTKPLLTHRR